MMTLRPARKNFTAASVARWISKRYFFTETSAAVFRLTPENPFFKAHLIWPFVTGEQLPEPTRTCLVGGASVLASRRFAQCAPNAISIPDEPTENNGCFALAY